MIRRNGIVWQILMIGFVFWVFGAIIPLLGITGASSVVARFTAFEGAAASHVLAALVEPFVTKFFPALAVVTLASQPREDFPAVVQRGLAVVDCPSIDLEMVAGRPFAFGAYGGLAFGVLEALGKIMAYDVGVAVGLMLAVLLHVCTGVLAAGSVFGTARVANEWVVGVVRMIGLASALLLHFAWNTGLNWVVIRWLSS